MNVRGKNLTEQLIREVHNKPLLWDKYHDLYNNRCATDREWGNLSHIMTQHKDFLRQKWKNLRDQFHKELRRVRTPLVGNSIQSYMNNYTGKWIYFEPMLFLRDTIKIKGSTHEIEHVEIPDDDIKEEIIEFDEESSFECEDNILIKINPTDTKTSNATVEGESCPIILAGSEYSETEKDNNNKIRKRTASEELPGQITCKRMSMTKISDNGDESDLSFFKSLLPFMRTLNPIRKLMVRNEIQNILIRENMCDKCNGRTCCSSSSPHL